MPSLPINELENVVWTEQPVIGLTFLLGGMNITDSYGDEINPNAYYNVGKHIPTGHIIIIPTIPICLN